MCTVLIYNTLNLQQDYLTKLTDLLKILLWAYILIIKRITRSLNIAVNIEITEDVKLVKTDISV